MRLGFMNLGGWSLKDSENKLFREQVLISSDSDIFCVVETFLKNKETLNVSGYTFYGHNRVNLHRRAKRGSGGVGIFVRNQLLNTFTVSVLDDTVEDILWVKLIHRDNVPSDNIVLCVAYLPPSDSVRNNDPEAFYCSLLEQVYAFQNEDKLFVCGDFNSRVGDDSDYIEGVDDVRPRDILDSTSNANGDPLIEFLVDCGLCMVNGRLGTNNYTHVSHRGKSVVDYVFVPYEQLLSIENFEVCLMSEMVQKLDMQGNNRIPDHSLLAWTIPLTNNVNGDHRTSVHMQNEQSRVSRTAYNLSKIPENFLNDESSIPLIIDTIRKIEQSLSQANDVSLAYRSFTDMLSVEMDKMLPKKNSTAFVTSTKYKPYWNEELQNAWDKVCSKERSWLRSNGNQSEKRKLRDAYNQERKHFDKLNRRIKRRYQMSEQTKLQKMYDDKDTRNFWKYIGRIGLQNDRKPEIPMEVVDVDGNVSVDTADILLRWKTDYETLYSDTHNPNFDDDHLRNIKGEHVVPPANMDVSALNAEITLAEVEKSVNRAKLRKAAGLDNISAELLRNPACVEALFKIIRYCFNTGTVPNDWNTGLIKPIPKSEGKDPRDPLSYRGITLISIPCKIYADILNIRLSKWIEENNQLVEEQNGFRSNRSCMEHKYTLYSVINKRKLNEQSTYACFVDAKKAFDTVTVFGISY